MDLNKFAKLVERSVRAQLRAGRRIVAHYWGNVNHSGDDISCGCAATMLVREQFGAEDALYIIRNEDDENGNDQFIADLFDCQPSNIREFRVGFDGMTVSDSEWNAAGRRARTVFVTRRKQSTSLTLPMLLEESESFLKLVLSNQRWPSQSPLIQCQAIAFMLNQGNFSGALDLRREHRNIIAESSLVLDKWLTEFFGE